MSITPTNGPNPPTTASLHEVGIRFKCRQERFAHESARALSDWKARRDESIKQAQGMNQVNRNRRIKELEEWDGFTTFSAFLQYLTDDEVRSIGAAIKGRSTLIEVKGADPDFVADCLLHGSSRAGAEYVGFRGEIQVSRRTWQVSLSGAKVVSEPVDLLLGWDEICGAVRKPKTFGRSMDRLNTDQEGPIRKQGSGKPPVVEREALVEWWNRLALAKLSNPADNIVPDERPKIGEINSRPTGDPDLEQGGSVKKRRSDRGKKRKT